MRKNVSSKILLIASILVCSSTAFSTAWAGDKKFGIGVLLGQPSGITGSYRVAEDRSINLVLGYDLRYYRGDSYFIVADYFFRHEKTIPVESIELGWYWGPGIFIWNRDYYSFDNPASDDELLVGPRVTAGLNYDFVKPSVEVFAEAGFGLALAEKIKGNVLISIGGRYYF